MKFILLVFASIIFSNLTHADQGKLDVTKAIDVQLVSDEWLGEKNLVTLLKKFPKPCSELLAKAERFKKVSFVKVRVLKAISLLNCDNKAKLINEYFNDTNIPVKAESIISAKSLSKQERLKFASKVAKLKKSTKDPLLLSAIKSFEN